MADRFNNDKYHASANIGAANVTGDWIGPIYGPGFVVFTNRYFGAGFDATGTFSYEGSNHPDCARDPQYAAEDAHVVTTGAAIFGSNPAGAAGVQAAYLRDCPLFVRQKYTKTGGATGSLNTRVKMSE